jgi:hypothetical protein
MSEEAIPVGERLGTQRLYDGSYDGSYDRGGGLNLSVEELARLAVEDPEMAPPERRDEPGPHHEDPRPAKPTPQPPEKVAPARKLAANFGAVNWREISSNTLELAGIMAITAGSWMIRAWLGLVVLGLCLILLGVATGVQRSE